MSVYIASNMELEFVAVSIIAGCIIQITFETFQLFASGFQEYFTDLWNWIDMAGIAGLLLYFAAGRRHLLLIGTMLCAVRAIRQLKVFSRFRNLIELLRATMVDMKEFLAVLLMIILIFTLLDMIVHSQSEGHKGFWFEYGNLYRTVMGENLETNSTFYEWLVYFFFTMLVNIIALNLLIAIITNTFDKVQATSDAQDCMIRAGILEEIGALLFKNRNKTELSYIHIALNANESIEGQDESDGWGGRNKQIIKRQEQVSQDVLKTDAKVTRVEDNLLDVKADMYIFKNDINVVK